MLSCILQDSHARKALSTFSGTLITSRLGRAEVIRTIHKVDPIRLADAENFFIEITLVDINHLVLAMVESYSFEITLKTSDAIHVATAEMILSQDDLLVTLDKAMVLNAEKLGLNVLTSS